MAIRFDHQTYAQRVVFAAGAARTRLLDEVARLGGQRVLVIATERERRVVQKLAAGLPVVIVNPSAPIGPWLVTRDEISEPQNLSHWLDADGVRQQDGTTTTMIYPVRFLVHYISQS